MCLDLDLNLGPLACEASVLPFCHGDLIFGRVKSWVFELFENLPVTTFLSEINNSHTYLEITLKVGGVFLKKNKSRSNFKEV